VAEAQVQASGTEHLASGGSHEQPHLVGRNHHIVTEGTYMHVLGMHSPCSLMSACTILVCWACIEVAGTRRYVEMFHFLFSLI